jgi:hypothetical protein
VLVSRFVSSHVSHARLHVSAYTGHETNPETSTERSGGGGVPHRRQRHQPADSSRSHGAARPTGTPAPDQCARSSLQHLEREVDPEDILPADERRRCAEHAKRAYMLRLAPRAVAARKAN